VTSWTSSRVAQVLHTAVPSEVEFSAVSTDTRTLEPGALFVALVGERFDGHAFLVDAQRGGALGAVVQVGRDVPDGLISFAVEDTLTALGDLAHDRRRCVTGPVVAVTGTNGKTATKEMLARALGTHWQVHATQGNLNNLIGVPLTILSAPPATEALVVEIGASVPGEVARLRDVTEPTIAVVTNVASGHLEGFGTLDDVLREKVSLLEGAPTAVVGTTPPELAHRARAVAQHVVTAGADEEAGVHPDRWAIRVDGAAEIVVRGIAMTLPIVGKHQVDNAMLALAVAAELGLDLVEVAAAVAAVSLPPGRCQVLRHGSLTVLHDAYNANPGSVAAALESAEALRTGRKFVVVLGSMLELGGQSTALHEEVADRVLAADPDLIAVTGQFVPAFRRHASLLGERLLTADDPPTLGKRLAGRLEGTEVVLVKASRGIRLERAIPYLIPGGDG
jgi:UDP-N-acetylmuramoyl-tripeptide--D-alanyl-D-alanine ligase